MDTTIYKRFLFFLWPSSLGSHPCKSLLRTTLVRGDDSRLASLDTLGSEQFSSSLFSLSCVSASLYLASLATPPLAMSSQDSLRSLASSECRDKVGSMHSQRVGPWPWAAPEDSILPASVTISENPCEGIGLASHAGATEKQRTDTRSPQHYHRRRTCFKGPADSDLLSAHNSSPPRPSCFRFTTKMLRWLCATLTFRENRRSPAREC